MITALVQFSLSEPMSAEKMAELSEANAPNYIDRDGLVRKYYVRSEDGTEVGGIYLWKTRAEADSCYDEAWRSQVAEAYGADPIITWLDTPVIVDNRHDEIVTD